MKKSLHDYWRNSSIVEDFTDHDNKFLGFGMMFRLEDDGEGYYEYTMLLELTTTIRIGQEDSLVFVFQQNSLGEFRVKALGVFAITSILSIKKFLTFFKKHSPRTKLLLVNLDATVLEAASSTLSGSGVVFLVSRYSVDKLIDSKLRLKDELVSINRQLRKELKECIKKGDIDHICTDLKTRLFWFTPDEKARSRFSDVLDFMEQWSHLCSDSAYNDTSNSRMISNSHHRRHI